MTNQIESPDIIYGRLLEGAHTAGYSFERALTNLEWLLGGDGWRTVGSGFDDINDFMASIKLDDFRITVEQRKQIAKRIKELQPDVSQRKIAGVLGVSKDTVAHDLGRPRGGDNSPAGHREQTADTTVGGDNSPPPPTSEISGQRAAKLASGRVERERRDREAEERRIEEDRNAAAVAETEATVDLRLGDFREVLADLSNVDAIITDPPYGAEHLELLEGLRKWSNEVLAPTGVLAVLFGQAHLPEVFRLLDGGRPYRWTGCLLTDGAGYVSHTRKVQSNWKPILIYGGGPRIADVVRSEGADIAAKSHHKWGQDYAAFSTLVERLTLPGTTVVDPFAGSGTTLLAAKLSGRHAIGCDIDAEHVETARRRLGI